MSDGRPVTLGRQQVGVTRFRRGEKPAEAVPLVPGPGVEPSLPEYRHSGKSRREETLETLETWPELEVAGSVVPPDRRHPRVTKIFTVGQQFLVFTGRGKRDDGSPFNHVEVRSTCGEIINKVELPWQGYMNSSGPDCAIAYQDEIVRIYSPDATLEVAFSLKDLPEKGAVREAHNQLYREQDLPFSMTWADASPRLVTASLSHRLLALTVADHVFFYDFDGNVLMAASLPRKTVYKDDCVDFVRFSRKGTLYVGGHSGIFVEIDQSGVVLQTWRMGQAPWTAIEIEGGLTGITRGDMPFRLEPQGRVHLESPVSLPVGDMIGPYMVSSERNKIAVFDFRSLSGFRVTLPQPRTAMYLEGGRLVFETATKKFSLKD
ncbi:hypothetical protein [Pseudarthrobacter sp. 1C304]|uniref:hypothetical protein n=1 Tax=Pseudarthrobacter sp. 1C304 TaxID=3457438 RepID=UPI003FD007CB